MTTRSRAFLYVTRLACRRVKTRGRDWSSRFQPIFAVNQAIVGCVHARAALYARAYPGIAECGFGGILQMASVPGMAFGGREATDDGRACSIRELAALRAPCELLERDGQGRSGWHFCSSPACLVKKVWLKTLAHKGLCAAAMLICMRLAALWRPSRISRAT